MVGLIEELVLLAVEDDGRLAYTASKPGFGIALIGACLYELSISGRIDADLDSIILVSSEPTGNPVLDAMLKAIAGEEQTDIAHWILRFVPMANEVVSWAIGSLVRKGILSRQESSFLWVLKSRRYPVRDGTEQKEAKLRIIETLLGDDLPTLHDTVMLELARAGDMLELFLSPAEIARMRERIQRVGGIDLFAQGVIDAIHRDQTLRAQVMMIPIY